MPAGQGRSQHETTSSRHRAIEILVAVSMSVDLNGMQDDQAYVALARLASGKMDAGLHKPIKRVSAVLFDAASR